MDRALAGLIDQFPRPSDLTHYPTCISEEARCGTGIRAETVTLPHDHAPAERLQHRVGARMRMFPGYHFSLAGLTVAKQTLSNIIEKTSQLKGPQQATYARGSRRPTRLAIKAVTAK